MKSRIFIILFFSWLACLFITIPVAIANPIDPFALFNTQAIAITIGILIFLLIFTILIESGLLYFSFRKDFQESKFISKFFKSIVVVNLFTFPLTQLVGLLLSVMSIQIFLLLIFSEIIPISIEYLLYIRIFDEFHKSNYVLSPISRKKISISTITANLITFSLGIFIFLPSIISQAFR